MAKRSKPAVVLLTEEERAKFNEEHGPEEEGWDSIAAKKNGEVLWQIAIRRPARMEAKRFRSAVQDPGKKSDAQENLVRSTLIFPTLPKFEELLEYYPLICDSDGVSAVVKGWTGLDSEEHAK